jgi:hypothetical protein
VSETAAQPVADLLLVRAVDSPVQIPISPITGVGQTSSSQIAPPVPVQAVPRAGVNDRLVTADLAIKVLAGLVGLIAAILALFGWTSK